MALFDDLPLHDFADRSLRKLLENAANFRELLMEATPALGPYFKYDQIEILPRSFLLEDWRRRESDLLFRVPFEKEGIEGSVLVCILLEHQSAPDPRMSLRTLIYTVLYWEQEWKAWEENHAPNEPLKLTPVLPIVFHSGTESWRTYRDLFSLMNGPELFRPYIPHWDTLFWDLADQKPEDLLRKAGAWMQAMAVVRAEKMDVETFYPIFEEALRKLGELSGEEAMRGYDLLWFVLSWAFRRRAESEREELTDVVNRSQLDPGRRKEVETMIKTVNETWEQRTFREIAEAEVRAKTEGKAEASRDALRVLLEDRFGTLPPELDQQIEAVQDSVRLRDALRQAIHVPALSDFKL